MDKNFYKNSLNIFNSDFSMKANLSQKEVFYRSFWEREKIYQKALKMNKNKQSFILHDGPPYANGDIHIGHALNKILKDIIVRYKTMQGFYAPFVPGWDTHGLPIENKIISQIKDQDVVQIRTLANNYANSQVQSQMSQFKKLDLFTDFSKIYQTNKPSYEAKQLQLFKEMVSQNLIYRGLKPVYWSTSSQSALAEAEIEYFDHRSPSIYVAFEVENGNDFVLAKDKLIIWTTTPWTLIANSGVAVGENFVYTRFEYQGNFYVVAQELLDNVLAILGWKDVQIHTTFRGKDLLGITYKRPIKDKISPIVLGGHVTLDSGSGLVHMAPLFGEDDFWIGKEFNLEMIMHVNDDGTFNEQADQFANLFYEDANKQIGQFLEEKNSLLHLSFIKHSFPHDWRTHKPVIYRGTPQWFISVEKIKQGILKEIQSIDFPEHWLKNRLEKMIEGRKDWIISRQRSWGVPLIIFYDEKGKPVLDKLALFDHVIYLIEKHGSDIWYQWSTDELLPEQFRNRNWTKELDILDVWYDSGSSFLAADIDGEKSPFDLYLEGSDQYRGWFNSSLINSYIYQQKSPYKKLLSHGFVVDAKGNKMSKSKGNGISPLELIDKYGTDVLRLWVANSEYFNDVVYSKEIFEQNVEIYRKIRNTIRFLITNLIDYKDDSYQREGIHAYIANKIVQFKNEIITNYDNYHFVKVVKLINNFIIEISNFYLSIVKDSLYADKQDHINRRAIQKNLYELLNVLVISIAPIMPTTAEEVYSFINKEDKKVSVHLENFFEKSEFNQDLDTKWKEFFEIKDKVYKLVEKAIKSGVIKRANEAYVKIASDSKFIHSLDLKMLLMIGDFSFASEFAVEKFESSKCLRCWNHFSGLNKDLCSRCEKFLEGYKADGQ
ncbi:Isoleucine--tRNA ligase [Mesomycoplasma conjunctivae]|uniref:Isoleucine--tRNA ligase n=1 Tax=Mesomycoplasma conjunctivae (strain ATCC 25834 / NCTC 10147 / HRC/581) TaxID=572263 RepID=C5J6X1_MESCH|nr:isoleucine--tRNA ligase [Mesomycoplasma conjunctivae]CAT05234.1 Isoleucyl-tRNA synthetase [Mesomycoplasma conjunctivae]VEU66455.1 Isoleucine--tRNA ligase [Mesomycoplasma conjunctivae]